MQSQSIEIVFSNYERECIRFLKIMREIESNFTKNVNVTNCQLGFQIQNRKLHLYTAQQSLVQSQSNAIFMVATFNQGFYKISNYQKPVAFGVRLKGFISKLLICKKQQIDQIKFVVTQDTLVFYLCDKNAKGWISTNMAKLPLELRDFNYNQNLNVLIDIGEIREEWMERNKKGKLAESLSLEEDKIELQTIQKNYVSCERAMKPDRDMKNYNSEEIFNYFNREEGKVMIKMFHSFSKHFAFYKGLGFGSAKMKLYCPRNPGTGETRFFLEMWNGFFTICKSFYCKVHRGEEDQEMIRGRNNPTVERSMMDNERKRRQEENISNFKIQEQYEEPNHQSQFASQEDPVPRGHKRQPTYIVPEADKEQIGMKMAKMTLEWDPNYYKKFKEIEEEISRNFMVAEDLEGNEDDFDEEGNGHWKVTSQAVKDRYHDE